MSSPNLGPRPSGAAAQITQAARELSADRGLHGWTMRDLERAAHASPSTIYHHTSGRQELLQSVVESILEEVEVPPPDVPDYREAFRKLTGDLYCAVTPYPGTAAWLMALGPKIPKGAQILELGIGWLLAAGVRPAGLACAQILSTALGVIASADAGRGSKLNSSAILDRLKATTNASPSRKEVVAYMSNFVVGDQELPAAARDFFDAAVDVVLAGVHAGYRDGSIRGAARFSTP